jgi:hypothetical protein
MHLVWAWIKLPLAVGAAMAFFLVVMEGALQFPRGVAPIAKWVLTFSQLVTSLLVTLYAMLVLILLNLPGVRRYFAQRS